MFYIQNKGISMLQKSLLACYITKHKVCIHNLLNADGFLRSPSFDTHLFICSIYVKSSVGSNLFIYRIYVKSSVGSHLFICIVYVTSSVGSHLFICSIDVTSFVGSHLFIYALFM